MEVYFVSLNNASYLNASSLEPNKTAFLTGSTPICCIGFQNTTADGNSDDCSCKRQTRTKEYVDLEYSKTCVKRPLSKRPKNGFQDQLSVNAGQKYCRMLPLEHSAILLTFIKVPFSIKTFVFSSPEPKAPR